ncbi:DUF4258 domain-containing protein [Tenacibaculum maritimum]|uniref:DUF4258 domain-containing protein n=1 Tax=Tenacibaculum maritimum TaxID=107401 RepID=UPI0012E4AF20|nr:DUF4258 domain-containing protein [Tenacibaculum maritimum]MCD9584304.1 DUF4258 domain-containing protein [Tenacibaculum maritimum]MCD9609671.1 DUF4258 domain-containing protein [Tenacibaculum maritimum]MCD9620175.1 DUF4258 domain-containing protein [Tenacibaculum maritimum]MCD9626302.1 DUF4258 domain-containing protein [Tenacibaculum maritimum]MCD9629212.1 DUF4258 domain-containing protein [Tenacibaculum maritimum]
MQWLKRFGYYFIGLTLGSFVVLFFWKNKKVSFDYGMDARTLKSIRIKKRVFSSEAKKNMLTYNIDTAKISKVLKYGDVNFSKSKARKKPCAEYYITGADNLQNISLYIKRCDSIATITNVYLLN